VRRTRRILFSADVGIAALAETTAPAMADSCATSAGQPRPVGHRQLSSPHHLCRRLGLPARPDFHLRTGRVPTILVKSCRAPRTRSCSERQARSVTTLMARPFRCSVFPRSVSNRVRRSSSGRSTMESTAAASSAGHAALTGLYRHTCGGDSGLLAVAVARLAASVRSQIPASHRRAGWPDS
jgi:hypothetical protein